MRHPSRNVIQRLAPLLGHDHGPADIHAMTVQARIRLEGEHHARLDLVRVVERDQPADHRLLPDRQADAVAHLQREGRLLVREADVNATTTTPCLDLS